MLVYYIVDLAYQFHYILHFASDNQLAILCIRMQGYIIMHQLRMAEFIVCNNAYRVLQNLCNRKLKTQDPRPFLIIIEVVSKRTIAYKPQGHSIITTSA